MLRDENLSNVLPTLIVVDDEPDFLRGLARSIPKEIPSTVLTAERAADALRLVDERHVDLVLSDIRMPDMDGIELLAEIKSRDPWITVVIMTAYGTIHTAVEAIRKGAYDFVQKPFTPDEINRVLKKALERNSLIRENIRLRNRLTGVPASDLFVSGGPGTRKVLRTIRAVADLNVTVLIRGESGTGKEVAARHIHLLSPRADRPMVTVNCPAIPESLLESELFGYAKGAFTGAGADKKGLLQEADGSTLFLDEIGDVSAAIQTKLLRLIQEKEIKSLGSSRSKTVDVRIIAATNRDLEKKIVEKTFREDLFYRLNVVSVFMPPLREIPEDIPLLAQRFVQQAESEYGIAPKSISAAAMKYLMGRAWPGNIRQLKNAIQRAMIFGKDNVLEIADFEDDQSPAKTATGVSSMAELPFRTARDKLIQDFTENYVCEALSRNNGNVSAAARESGLERQHFQKLMRKCGISSNQYKDGRNYQLQCSPEAHKDSIDP
jgi:DNA-binding NtrC family response regulator